MTVLFMAEPLSFKVEHQKQKQEFKFEDTADWSINLLHSHLSSADLFNVIRYES